MGSDGSAKRSEDLEHLLRISSVLTDETLGLNFRLQETTTAILKVLGAKTGSIMLLEREELVVLAASNPKILGLRRNLRETSVATDVVRTGRMNLLRKMKPESHDISRYQSNFSASLPLFSDGKVMGVLNVTDKDDAADFTVEEIDFLEHFKKWIEIILVNQGLRRRIAELSAKSKTTLDHPALF